MKDTIDILLEDVEIIDASEYNYDVAKHFSTIPEIAEPLLKNAKTTLYKIDLSKKF